jgi:hypothetical protein
MKNFVALLTDFGAGDNFVAVMKAIILGINPATTIIDISHDIARHNIKDAAFLLMSSFSYFPKGTVFLAVVDPGVGSNRDAIAVKTKNYFFVGPDNGILSLAAGKDTIEKIVALEKKGFFLEKVSSTFHGRDIFAPVTAYISRGTPITRFGKHLKKLKEIIFPVPRIQGNTLEAEIVYQDKFGNLITNTTKEQFLNFVRGKKFIATLRNKRINKIYSFYAQAKNDEPFFIEGSFSFLEISLKNKNAAAYFGVKGNEKIKITIT